MPMYQFDPKILREYAWGSNMGFLELCETHPEWDALRRIKEWADWLNDNERHSRMLYRTSERDFHSLFGRDRGAADWMHLTLIPGLGVFACGDRVDARDYVSQAASERAVEAINRSRILFDVSEWA